jgi:uncharacterized protein YbaP (TraB family)
MCRKRLAAGFLVFSSFFSFAQVKPGETQSSLLWEISGKGIKEPGYLFGTIHLKDNRVFNFYDSLLPKISACRQFAIEIDPDTLVRGTFAMETKEDSVIDLRDGSSSKEYKDLEDKLEEELGFSLRRLNRKQLRALKSYFGGEKDRADDKPTFLDAWLCDFARRTGKKICGLETFEGHMEGYETIKKDGIGSLDWESILAGKNKPMLEEMISNYLSNDHVKIERMYATTAGEDELASLQKRNHAMAVSIDSLLKNGSLFSAVGSAHLAGQEGVINLLRKMGYTVRPVNTARTGYYKKLKYEYMDDSWKRENFPEFGYSVVFPAKPFKIERENSLLYSWTDIGSGINYFSMGTFLQDNTSSFVAELSLRMIVEGLKKSEKIKIKNSEVKTGDSSTELTIETESIENHVTKMRYIIKDNVMYSIFAEYHKNNEHPEDVERFLKSFKFTEKKEAEWKTFSSKAGAFEIYIPQEPKEKIVKTRENGSDFETHYFTVYDAKTNGTYFFRYFDLPAGYSYADDSLILKTYSDDILNSQGKAVNRKKESKNSFLDYPSWDLEADYDDYTSIKAKTILRGGRVYTLMFTASKEKIDKQLPGTFFNSFDLKPFLPGKLKAATLPSDPAYSFSIPGQLILARGDTAEKENIRSTYSSVDAASGTNYFYSAKDFAPFYYAKNDSVFYSDADALFLTKDDSIVSFKNSRKGESRMREFSAASKTSVLTKRVKYFNSGRRIYAVIAMLNENEKEKTTASAVFNSVSYNGTPKHFDFSKKKTAELLSSLTSADTSLFRRAKDFLSGYNFEGSDLPLLKDALQKKYADDDDTSGSVSMKLLNVLVKINDAGCPDIIGSVFPVIRSNAPLSRAAWKALLSMNNAAAAKTALEVMNQNTIDKKISCSQFSCLDPESETAKILFPSILGKTDESNDWSSLYDIAVEMEKKNKLKREEILAYAEKIFGNLNNLAENDPSFVPPFNFLSWMEKNDAGNPWFKDHLSKLQSAKNPKAKLNGILLSLKNNVAVNKKAVEELAALKEYRLSVFETLEENGKQDLYPKKYFNQVSFSESDFAEWMSKNGKKFDKVEFVKEMIFDYRGFKQKMIVYKLTYTKEGEQKIATGFAGPYPPKAEYPTKRADFTGTTLQEFYPDMLDVLIRQHIKKVSGN